MMDKDSASRVQWQIYLPIVEAPPIFDAVKVCKPSTMANLFAHCYVACCCRCIASLWLAQRPAPLLCAAILLKLSWLFRVLNVTLHELLRER